MTPYLTLDFVSKRYGLLPSEFLARGSTLDIECAEIAVSHEQYLHDKAAKKSAKPGEAPPAPQLTQEQMQAMIDRVRNK